MGRKISEEKKAKKEKWELENQDAVELMNYDMPWLEHEYPEGLYWVRRKSYRGDRWVLALKQHRGSAGWAHRAASWMVMGEIGEFNVHQFLEIGPRLDLDGPPQPPDNPWDQSRIWPELREKDGEDE